MEIIRKIQDFINSLDEKEFLRYIIIFFSGLFFIFAISFYLHYRRLNYYKQKLVEINKERTKTRDILANYRIVMQQKEKVNNILDRDKNFIIAQTYGNILKKLNLESKQIDIPTKSDGPIISGKIEKKLRSKLDNITMKELTDLLLEIAFIDRLYPKELTIKKNQNAKTIEIDLEIATLEPVTNVE